MKQIVFSADSRKASAAFCDPITSGSAGVPIVFRFSPEWDGLQKTAVFRGAASADVVLDGDVATVPAAVLSAPGAVLRVGVWGADADSVVIIPTVWAEVGTIVPGAAPSGIAPGDPAPSWAVQVQQIAAEALQTANSLRADVDYILAQLGADPAARRALAAAPVEDERSGSGLLEADE